MYQPSAAPFLRDPITVPRKELIEHYRAQAARYKQLAERQHRSSVYEGLLGLARQCAAMADALAMPRADQSAKPALSEPENPASAQPRNSRRECCFDCASEGASAVALSSGRLARGALT
jgi:hypothetical protein